MLVGLCCHPKPKENSVPVASEKASFSKRDWNCHFFRGVCWLHAYLATDLRLVFKCITWTQRTMKGQVRATLLWSTWGEKSYCWSTCSSSSQGCCVDSGPQDDSWAGHATAPRESLEGSPAVASSWEAGPLPRLPVSSILLLGWENFADRNIKERGDETNWEIKL